MHLKSTLSSCRNHFAFAMLFISISTLRSLFKNCSNFIYCKWMLNDYSTHHTPIRAVQCHAIVYGLERDRAYVGWCGTGAIINKIENYYWNLLIGEAFAHTHTHNYTLDRTKMQHHTEMKLFWSHSRYETYESNWKCACGIVGFSIGFEHQTKLLQCLMFRVLILYLKTAVLKLSAN